MNKKLPSPVLAFVWVSAILLATSDFCFGGGGGGAGKSSQALRIKNTSSGVTSSPSTSISTVLVGDPGNESVMIEGMYYGGVADPFRIGKFEVTIQQYATFLNTVATRPDTYDYGAPVVESLYDSRMGSDKNVAGITRTGQGTAASPYSYQVDGDGNRPITYVTFHNAARFANWMHNGALASSSLEDGAYHINGELTVSVSKDPGAKWWIPSEHEWFKAAYYKGGSTSAGYYKFPTKSDTLPGNTSDSLTNQANFLRSGVYTTTQSSTLQTTESYLTPVGNFYNSPSAYGTFDQGGNVDEWVDALAFSTFGVAYITRGGAWNTGGLNNDASPASTALPTDRSNKIGFRLARAPSEPGPPVPSGNFEVKLTTSGSQPRTIAPNQIAQYTVKPGQVTVVATDVLNPTLSAQATFTIPTKGRRTYIVVNNDNDQINIVKTTTPF